MALSGNARAQKNIVQFQDYVIKQGAYSVIGGQKRYDPDVYYTRNPDGNYKAHRLTVQPLDAPERVSAPYIHAMRPDGVTIGWKTDTAPSGVEVRWGEQPDALDHTVDFSTNTLASDYHWNTATITGLEADKVYYYSVRSNAVESGVQRFHTMPVDGSQKVLRMLILGDHQRNSYSDYEWMLRMAERKLNEKYGEKPLEDHVAFIMNMGDQVDGGNLNQYEKTHRFKSRFVMKNLPTQTVVGNHETYGDSDLKLYNGHYGAYRGIAYRGLDSGTPSYYAYQTGRVLWICLNSDGASPQQRMWVRKVVAVADADPTVDFILSVQHRPLYAEMYSKDVSPWMLNDVMPILDSSPKHVMNCAGHHHLYARGQMPDKPVYHMISGGGVGVAVDGYQQIWGETMVDIFDHDHVQATIDHWTYQIVEFDPATQTMSVECYSVGNKRLAVDNMLVDSFCRSLSAPSVPGTPELQEPEGTLALPASIEQKEVVKGLHSAQYQVARDEAFTQPELERIYTYENLFDVDEHFMPLDRYAERPVTRLDLGADDLKSGTYYVRVRNRSMNLDYSDWSKPVRVSVQGKISQVPTVETDDTWYGIGEEVTVSYSNAPVGQDAWVGIYRNGDKPGGGSYSYAYKYTTAASGTLTFHISDAGKYFAVLFSDGGYNECSERVYFRVGEGVEELATDKFVYKPGEAVYVQLQDAPCGANDWVGIYPVGTTPSSSICPTWVYVGNNPNARLTLNVEGTHNYAAPLPEGAYFVGYFLNNGYEEATERAHFMIGAGCLLESAAQQYAPGQPVLLMWEGVPAGMACTLSRREEATGQWTTVEKLTATGGTLWVDGLPEGEHTFCIFMNGTPMSHECVVRVTGGTAIQEVRQTARTATDVYSLSGQRMPEGPLPKGLYVKNGRKMMK